MQIFCDHITHFFIFIQISRIHRFSPAVVTVNHFISSHQIVSCDLNIHHVHAFGMIGEPPFPFHCFQTVWFSTVESDGPGSNSNSLNTTYVKAPLVVFSGMLFSYFSLCDRFPLCTLCKTCMLLFIFYLFFIYI